LGIATLIPAWAVEVLGGDATTSGFLLAARGFGSLIGALLIAAMGRMRFRGKVWTVNSILLPIMMFVFALMTWLIPSLLAMAAMGFTFMMIVNLSNAMVQTRIADEMRGRVMGVYTFFFFGAMPLGSLISGWAADVIGEPRTVIICAIILLLFALWVIWRRPALRAME
jgi:predicted MFS family arabinose efflux permease